MQGHIIYFEKDNYLWRHLDVVETAWHTVSTSAEVPIWPNGYPKRNIAIYVFLLNWYHQKLSRKN